MKGTPTMVTSKARGGWSSKDSEKKGKKNGRRVATGSASLTNWLGTARTSTPEVKSLGSKVISKGGNLAGVGQGPPCHKLPTDPEIQPSSSAICSIGSVKVQSVILAENARIALKSDSTPQSSNLEVIDQNGPNSPNEVPNGLIGPSDDSDLAVFIPTEAGLIVNCDEQNSQQNASENPVPAPEMPTSPQNAIVVASDNSNCSYKFHSTTSSILEAFRSPEAQQESPSPIYSFESTTSSFMFSVNSFSVAKFNEIKNETTCVAEWLVPKRDIALSCKLDGSDADGAIKDISTMEVSDGLMAASAGEHDGLLAASAGEPARPALLTNDALLQILPSCMCLMSEACTVCVITTRNSVPAHLMWDHLVKLSTAASVSRAGKRAAEQVSFNYAFNLLHSRESGIEALANGLKKVKLGSDVSSQSPNTVCDIARAADVPKPAARVSGKEMDSLTDVLSDALKLHGEASDEI